MPRIEYAISDISNRYAFVSDLSNWNGTVFPARRKEWIARTGALTSADRSMLKKFSVIHRSSDPLFFLVFFDPHCSSAPPEDLKDILSYFDARFQKIWKVEKPKLERLRKTLARRDAVAAATTNHIVRLCGIGAKKTRRVTCLLGMSASAVPDCNGWTSGNNVIVLECSGWPEKRTKEIYREIIPHELFHLLLRNNNRLLKNLRTLAAENEPALAKINFEGYSSRMVLEEIVLSSFIPEGYLIHKKVEPPRQGQKDFQAVRQHFAYLLQDEAKKYVTAGKSIGKAYLEKVMGEIDTASPTGTPPRSDSARSTWSRRR